MIYILKGRARVGKDTVGAFLSNGTGLETYALAGPIKDLAAEWLGWGYEHLHGTLKEEPVVIEKDDELYMLDMIIYSMFKGRHEAITPAMARTVADVIIEKVIWESEEYYNDSSGCIMVTTPRKVLQIIGTEGFRDTVTDTFWLDLAPKDNVIITDVRFPNEADYFTINNEVPVEAIHIKREGSIKVNSHSSEQDLDVKPNDHLILNDGTMEELAEVVEGIIDVTF